MRAARAGRMPRLGRTVLRVERRVMSWPPPVGLARVLGALCLAAAGAQLLTWPLVGAPSPASPHGALLAVNALGSLALLAAPNRTLTRVRAHLALVAAIAVETGYAVTTGALESPYLGGYVALVLVAALFTSRRMTLLTLAVTIGGLLLVALADRTPSGEDIARLAAEGTICVLVGFTTSLLASRQRRDLRRAEQRLQRSRRETSQRRTEALLDPLTGLRNRRAFDTDLAAALAERRRNDGLLLAMVDADGLKGVNDTFGHPAGDRALQAIAAALRARVRAQDCVYRLGGDEFAMLLTSSDPAALGTRLAHHIEAEVAGAGRIRVSVGVAYAQAGDTPVAIAARADAALYASKRQRAGSDTAPA